MVADEGHRANLAEDAVRARFAREVCARKLGGCLSPRRSYDADGTGRGLAGERVRAGRVRCRNARRAAGPLPENSVLALSAGPAKADRLSKRRARVIHVTSSPQKWAGPGRAGIIDFGISYEAGATSRKDRLMIGYPGVHVAGKAEQDERPHRSARPATSQPGRRGPIRRAGEGTFGSGDTAGRAIPRGARQPNNERCTEPPPDDQAELSSDPKRRPTATPVPGRPVGRVPAAGT